MSIIYKQTEFIFFFQSSYFFDLSLVARHSEYTFCYHQYTAARFSGHICRALQLLIAVLNIIVLVHITVARYKTETIDNASMRFSIVNHNIMTTAKTIDCGYHTLVAIIEEHGVFF